MATSLIRRPAAYTLAAMTPASLSPAGACSVRASTASPVPNVFLFGGVFTFHNSVSIASVQPTALRLGGQSDFAGGARRVDHRREQLYVRFAADCVAKVFSTGDQKFSGL